MQMVKVGNKENHLVIDRYRKAVADLEKYGDENFGYYQAKLDAARAEFSSLVKSEKEKRR